MEETLKSARSVHLVLLGVCGAIALFAASPREIDAYVRAKTEVEALRDLDMGDFVRHVKETINTRPTLPWLQPQVLFPNGEIKTSLSLTDLFPVRNEIGAMKISEAAQYLENRIYSKNRKIDVLGASVDEKLAVLAAPAAALLTLIYFALIIRHTGSPLTASTAEARAFPWIGLFPGLLAAAVVYISAWLPAGACLWLVWNSRTYASPLLLTAALTIVVGMILTAMSASRHLHNVRRKVSLPAELPPPPSLT